MSCEETWVGWNRKWTRSHLAAMLSRFRVWTWTWFLFLHCWLYLGLFSHTVTRVLVWPSAAVEGSDLWKGGRPAGPVGSREIYRDQVQLNTCGSEGVLGFWRCSGVLTVFWGSAGVPAQRFCLGLSPSGLKYSQIKLCGDVLDSFCGEVFTLTEIRCFCVQLEDVFISSRSRWAWRVALRWRSDTRLQSADKRKWAAVGHVSQLMVSLSAGLRSAPTLQSSG